MCWLRIKVALIVAYGIPLAFNPVGIPTQADEIKIFVSSFAPAGEAGIYAYTINGQTGSVTETAKYTEVGHPFFLSLSPDKQTLYSIHAQHGFGGTKHEEIAAFRIVDGNGNLKLLNTQSTHGTASCYLDVDKKGELLVVANYSSGDIASYPITKEGIPEKSVSFYKHNGASVNEARQKEPHAHCIVVSPDNKYVFSADLGIDRIVTYKLRRKGRVTPLNDRLNSSLAPGSGPRHLTFHPHGNSAYVINELLNTVTVFDYNARDGSLSETQTISTLPKEFGGVSYTADIKLTPNGNFAYGTNRGHDSLACYRVQETGTLELIEIVPSLGAGPQNLAVTHDGKMLICANMPGNNLALFRIDQRSGKLTQVGPVHKLTSPSCIMLR